MEFHAVICCGKGGGLSPLSMTRETGIPKALLPIGNKPMIEYVLEWCDKAPFGTVSVVGDSESNVEITSVVEAYKTKRPKNIHSHINIVKFDGDATGGILSEFIEKANHSNLIFLPCDFVTDLPPQVLIEEFRNRNDEDIAMSVHYHNKFESIDKKNLTNYYTVYSDDDHLLDIYAKDSVEASKFLEIRTQMIWRYPNSNVSTKLLDSFIYFFSTEAINAVQEETEDYKTKSLTKILRDLARRSWRHSKPKGTVSLLNLPSQCTFVRADNLPAYMEANRYIMRLKAKAQQQPPQAKEKGAATIGADSVVGENTTLGERTSVKKTVVGKHAKIGKRVRLTGSVILDGVQLEDDVVLENCIVGKGAIIHAKSKLVNCNIEGSYSVSKGSNIKGETLTNLFIEGQEESSSESESDSEDYDSYEDDFEDDFEDDGLFER
ncbi:UDP-N-acetylglucosamine pyrophosphorylase [Wickerhamomyces ciferrii]|uniref:Translation initiation factor eIF2B subunit gamma n=1 Tax=Wickerhamomyces ciferrii (strain ATCC 14091 / BCRC 22168 / CBS 111 / JCM 3599 / NBRC 0793 / NRRL Y-1031 F-60-10) TaxID=1206466 RepID=K0KCW8_WICCF|nr:UDP-N-acetylglucosamine pyrophosphorylase [Wickerhamomyces ciferrii]CCH42950.1 UDP-N-acetylglucosamine pyrophosphorylase [Wickerhamomyces ciferrii]